METRGWDAQLRTTALARRAYRRRSLANLLKMGHCAPAVAQTVADLSGVDGEWLVLLAAGLPGGIGDTGFECGGLSAAVLLLGLRYGDTTSARGLPVVIEKGQAYCGRFLGCHRSVMCSAILGKRRVPLPCVHVVRRAPELLAETVEEEASAAIAADHREAHRWLLAHLTGRGFHCAHAVFRRLAHVVPVTEELLAATYGFVGGTLLEGMTCSALAAGVMAIGLGAGDVEWSRRRVFRMLGTMAVGGNALADGLNEFNRSVNRGKELARAFAAELGSTQCRAITGCSFSSGADVERFIAGDGVARCEAIAVMVAQRAEEIIERARAH